MKFFVKLCCVILMGLCTLQIAYAQQKTYKRTDKLTKGQANSFYKQCIRKNYAARSEDMQQAFCACSAANFFKKMTQGDVIDLAIPEGIKGIQAREKLLEFIYTPCLDDIITSLVLDECEHNRYLNEATFINKAKYCSCQAQRMPMIFKSISSQVAYQNRLNLDESLRDPIASFINNRIYINKSQEVSSICMKHAIIIPKKKYKSQAQTFAPLNTVIEPYTREEDK